MKYFLDFEATQYSQEIISFGAVSENNDEFYTLVKTDRQLTNFITRLTGITQEMLQDAPSPTEAFRSFFAFVAADANPEFYCYGNSDSNFISNTARLIDDFEIKIKTLGLAALVQNSAVDVCAFFNIAPSAMVSLSKLYELYFDKEETQTQLHNALSDAKMLKEVLTHLKNLYKPEDIKKLRKKKKTYNIPQISPERVFDIFSNLGETPWRNKITEIKMNCEVICHGPSGRILYFDTIDTAIVWCIKYFLTKRSLKKDYDIRDTGCKIEDAISKNQKFLGFRWERGKI